MTSPDRLPSRRAPRPKLGRALWDDAGRGVMRWVMIVLALLLPFQQAHAQSILRDAETEALLRDMAAPLVRAAGLDPRNVDVVLVGDMSINAFVMNGQVVYLNAGLINTADTANQVQGVIAHELGHVHHRHSLRHLLEGSASALFVGALVGDVSGVSTLTVNAPILLSTLHYTRESEREADQYAFDLLSKSGRSPKDFADAMRRFEAMELCMALRAKMRERDKNKTWKMGDPTDDDQSDNDEVSKPGDKSTPSKPLCAVDPEGFIKSQEGDGAELPSPQRETGYMHTHPVTRERIAAAEAAASK